MMAELIDWLKQLTVFMILCETILSFSPTKNYKRYIKPFVGMILLFRITVFLFGTTEIDWSKRVEDVLLHYENSISHYLEERTIVEEKLGNDVLNEDLIKIDRIIVDKIKIGEVE